MSRTRIRIHIDHLLLDGFSRREASLIREAIEGQIRERLESGEISADALPRRIDHVDGGSAVWNGSSSARAIAGRVADTVVNRGAP